MVTQAVLDILTMIAMAILDAIPDTEVPDWLNSAANIIPTVFNFAGSMGVWYPWGTLGMVMLSVLGCWTAAFIIKLARIVISFFTFGGGSAA